MDTLVGESELRSVYNFAKDFGQEFWHSGVEDPVNAVIQIADSVTGKQLPELEIVGDRHSHTAGSIAGSIAGKVADVFALSTGVGAGLDALGLVPGAGVMANAARLGGTGFLYGGLLQPSQPNLSPGELMWDRARQGISEGATWGALGAVATGLSLGLPYHVAKSLPGFVGIGTLSGAVGGVVHAESNELLTNGQFASLGTVASEAGQLALGGAVFGALNYADFRLQSGARKIAALKQIRDSEMGQPTAAEGGAHTDGGKGKLVVLLDDHAMLGLGHSAVVFGSDEAGWSHYSDAWTPKIAKYATLNDVFNANPRYTVGTSFPVDQPAIQQMQNFAAQNIHTYRFFGFNCADFSNGVAQSAGIDTKVAKGYFTWPRSVSNAASDVGGQAFQPPDTATQKLAAGVRWTGSLMEMRAGVAASLRKLELDDVIADRRVGVN